MGAENIVKKWGSCRYSLSFGFLGGDEAGHALADEGYNENYACERHEIVNSNQYPVHSFPEGESTTQVAVLHGIGKVDDPKVIEALKRSCNDCPLYKKDPWKI